MVSGGVNSVSKREFSFARGVVRSKECDLKLASDDAAAALKKVCGGHYFVICHLVLAL